QPSESRVARAIVRLKRTHPRRIAYSIYRQPPAGAALPQRSWPLKTVRMASLTHGAQVGRLEGVDTGRRRRWSEEERWSRWKRWCLGVIRSRCRRPHGLLREHSARRTSKIGSAPDR